MKDYELFDVADHTFKAGEVYENNGGGIYRIVEVLPGNKICFERESDGYRLIATDTHFYIKQWNAGKKPDKQVIEWCYSKEIGWNK